MPSNSESRFFSDRGRAARAAVTAMVAFCAMGVSAHASAAPITINFSGAIDFIEEDEYGTASPLPAGNLPLLPYFSGAKTVIGSFTYDPVTAIDSDPDPTAGQYALPGTFTMQLPEIGMTLVAAGFGMSVYTVGELHVDGSVKSFTGNTGGATPFAFDFDFYGQLANDSLPTGPTSWHYGNAHVSLWDVTPYRDMFIGVTPVPEPATRWMLIAALAGVGWLRRGSFVRPREAG